ncbi:tRNA pseudouridine synthase-like 1 [Stegastes partitus]|uniref:tRNA pseudouridine synthase n=1 Tax=Stegastes partitus TaxID=144197 RepID=A0A9Y4JIZ7_9TELE|nr:PREDICTED: tRNA pseudouridine synthase-like 1 [Stegastes partitus]
MSNAARYLIFFQYIGTKYSGVVKVRPHVVGKTGVQDHLEDAIRRLRPLNPASLSVSSRTDAGVHALSNSAHFDLQRKNDKPPFTEDVLVQALNYHLKTEQIRVTHAHRVSDDFHARYSAQSRTYIYRIALGLPHYSALPLVDCQLCWNLRNTELDVEAMREAAAMLVGTHDFSTFRAVNSDMPFKSPVKTLDVVDIQPGSSFAGAEDDRGLGGSRPKAALAAPAERDNGGSRLSDLPTGSGCSSVWPLPHQGGVQRDGPADTIYWELNRLMLLEYVC